MKTYTIDIHPNLKDVTIEVKNGAKFERAIIKGEYEYFDVKIPCELELKRIKKFAIKHADDYCSCKGRWFAHCNGFAMDLFINYKGEVRINTYRPYGKIGLKLINQ